MTLRALVADDDVIATAILARSLRQSQLDVQVVHDGAAAWDVLKSDAPSLVLVDWMMPGIDGVQLCRLIRQDPSLRHLYVILLTARDSPEDVVGGLEAGADDYIIKPFNPDELHARVNVGLRVVSLQAELSSRVRELEHARNELTMLASTDTLTGAATRRRWFEVADTELRRAFRHGTPLSVLLMDLDHFKAVNDTYGHAAGDEVLRAFAGFIQEECRQSDVLGRIGGEEFALLVPQVDGAGAMDLSQRILERCQSLRVPFGGAEIRPTCSIGVASLTSAADDVHSILQRADKALYDAKARGRNCAVRAAERQPTAPAA